MAERETFRLIGSDKVEGTAVYSADDRKIGSIERVMIDKMSGKVSYAVLSFGGFLGMGDEHYPCPGNHSNTTPRSTAIEPLSRRISSKAPRDTVTPIHGIGMTPIVSAA